MITALHYEYGDFGRLTKMTEKIVGDQSFETQYEYNAYGELIYQKDANNNTFTMVYNNKGQLTKLSEKIDGTVYTHEYTYNSRGDVLTRAANPAVKPKKTVRIFGKCLNHVAGRCPQ